mmetsp:Transcript_7878/g.12039  ORF Transcript_7878/g.12039 Transcript_7878/m.12039 type:complete len:961 (-) Transcript_7878:1421-4303(-)
MLTRSNYESVPGNEGGVGATADEDLYTVTGGLPEPYPLPMDPSCESLEIDNFSDSATSDDDGAQQGLDPLCSMKNIFHFSVVLTSIVQSLCLLKATSITFDLTGRMWLTALFTIHSSLISWAALRFVSPKYQLQSRLSSFVSVPFLLIDITFLATIYPAICTILKQFFFTEPDGTRVIEYSTVTRQLETIKFVCLSIALVRCTTILSACQSVCYRRCRNSTLENTQFSRRCATVLERFEDSVGTCSHLTRQRIQSVVVFILRALIFVSVVLFFWGFVSALEHLGSWSAPAQVGVHCDPLDKTECCFPFPSFHHMVPDSTTETGWRVNIRGDALPPLKGNVQIDAAFLNKLDGFSTMAPLLFYIDGLKESHESRINQNTQLLQDTQMLQGASSIALSVTEQSITLLLDVKHQKLIPHTAEIDYLDPDRPVVMVFPAKPLDHNRHYALAVVNGTDVNGDRLPPTTGMQELFSLHSSEDSKEFKLASRYRTVLIPSLTRAAPWFMYDQDPDCLQLLFDFHTISASSQLGPIRAVRDATMEQLSSPTWKWKDHARLIRREDNDCSITGEVVARTIHAELDVPWFLEAYGDNHRGAVLDTNAVANLTPVTTGKAKFMVHIPCSIKAAAMNKTQESPVNLRAIVEYGHGLFYHREEVSESPHVQMAHENGYILMAMDWRGMSAFDLLIVIKTLMSTPRLFQATRDNLIQGYANKIALQHFAQNEMLSSDWLLFGSRFAKKRAIPTFDSKKPVSAFYGISQGGILGAGYTALIGSTNLIDRAILGVPGSPFALILTRSLEFQGYDKILLLNFYNNRHVRILLSLTQMAWDSTEGSGLLAGPIEEAFPRVLLQAGLGDSTVSTLAAEALARAFGAQTLPGNPRQIYGIPIGKPASEVSDGPHATLTELLFEEEYATLPVKDLDEPYNRVHYCVRKDSQILKQIETFIDSGKVIDVCEKDHCRRQSANC